MNSLNRSLTLAVLLTASARAKEPRGLGHWQGKGTTFPVGGAAAGDFTADLIRTQLAEGVVEVKGTLLLADGKTVTFSQKETQGEYGCRIEGDLGNGGGRCYGEGLCQTYVESGNGKAFATTVVLDGDDKLRLLVTELKDGQAVRVMRESVTRVER